MELEMKAGGRMVDDDFGAGGSAAAPIRIDESQGKWGGRR